MHLLGTVVVRPVLPDRISGLQELSRNLWWSWNPKALSLFSSLNPELWEEVGHNPVEVLARLDQQHMEKAAANPDWLRQNIWHQASRWETPDLAVRASGEPLNPAHYRAHLERRYLGS